MKISLFDKIKMDCLIGQLWSVMLVVSIGFQGNVHGRYIRAEERSDVSSMLEQKDLARELLLSLLENAMLDRSNVCVMQQSSIMKECLAAHNRVRGYHHAPALKWAQPSKTDEWTASQWAEMLAKTNKFEHDQKTGWGENIFKTSYLGDKPELPCAEAVRSWYSEVKDYKKPGFSPNTGHFTQLVWKETTDLNCGVAYNKANKVSFTVCRYNVRGNMEGEFEENVDPADLGLYQELESEA